MENLKPGTIKSVSISVAAAVAILAALITTAGVLWLEWWDPVQNRRVLASLPMPPDVKRIALSSNLSTSSDLYFVLPDYWGTNATFQAPGLTSEYLHNFYISHLSEGWEVCEHTIFDGVSFFRPDYTISINTENAYPDGPGEFEIYLAPDPRRKRCR